MRIGFASIEDPGARDAFSGSTFHLMNGLRALGLDLVQLGPFHCSPTMPERIAGWLWRKRRRNYCFRRTKRFLRSAGHYFSQKAAMDNCDFILSRGFDFMGNCPGKLPLIGWNDATFPLIKGRYFEFTNMAPPTERYALTSELAALRRTTAAIVTSVWAQQSLQADYGFDRSKIRVIPIGANRPSGWSSEEIRSQIAQKQFVGPLKLLFVASEPHRKGFDRAVAFCQALHGLGVPLELTCIGFGPQAIPSLPFSCRIVGRIAFSDSNRAAEFQEFFARSHFLLLPSRADCTPASIGDAFSFGLPVIASNVGGIPEMIRHGIDGVIANFDEPASINDAVDDVRILFGNPVAWRSLAHAAYSKYATELNWNCHCSRVLLAFRDSGLPQGGSKPPARSAFAA